ncbi:Receptor-type guanylate cyclase gcy [Seminavis robusta]|uniref:Receptor-type guanylate cyclase gcy n=1 Tax=Seminavis robusta TaxID=568900 RepID=A0A9N8HMB1_9STRA|nr:Receptor-type guanylate cyclase gcy [Seminavis robusta]|eukprot:Sro882_g215340.1 Receptor-type guanylate cyclase gcy (867) ;mRNA; f:21036-24182
MDDKSFKDEGSDHGSSAGEEAGSCSVLDVSSSNNKNDRQEIVHRLKQELRKQDNTSAVRALRIMVLGLLFAAAAGVSLGLFFYATNEEQDDFETAFEIHATKILESFSNTLERRLVAFDTLANTITNYVHSTPGVEFPFVTLPNFEVAGAGYRVQGSNAIVHFMPMVTNEKREAWEVYSLENRFHIDRSFLRDKTLRQNQDAAFEDLLTTMEAAEESAGKQKSDEGQRSLQQGQAAAETEEQEPEIYNITLERNNVTETFTVEDNVLQDGTGFHPKLYFRSPATGVAVLPPRSGPFFPLWQRSPVNVVKQGTLNLNFMEGVTLKGVLPYLLEDPKCLVNRAIILPQNEDGNFKKNLLLSQYRHSVDEYSWDPVSFAVYPIFDDFYNPTESVQHHRDHLAGVLVTNFYWRLYFQDILPADAKGIILVLSNSFNQTFSYRVDGPDVTFLGEVDPVDMYQKYKDMGVTVDATSYAKSRARPETRTYTTVPLHDTFGVYTLSVYPSADTENEYTSKQPLIFCLVVATVFICTVLVFILFDCLVERRQRIVLNRALQSGALVSSLFPEQVQNRLYDEHSGNIGRRKQDEETAWKVGDGQDNVEGVGQIADVYNNTTIFFADLAGFTKWSSTRQPKDVFLLLETLYSAFDNIGERRNVYKIETIGDCYVAITGCPTPQVNHTVIMVKFARDCLNKMGQLTHKLADTLGEDTLDLGFRVGLHSGPVTAGVLRGKKARFQLFGDAVNVASRMESNGVPGKIHVSQAVADELIASGNGSWLTPREDMIVPKGKGTMQTYFVRVASSPGTSKSHLSSLSKATSDRSKSTGTSAEPTVESKSSLASIRSADEGTKEEDDWIEQPTNEEPDATTNSWV